MRGSSVFIFTALAVLGAADYGDAWQHNHAAKHTGERLADATDKFKAHGWFGGKATAQPTDASQGQGWFASKTKDHNDHLPGHIIEHIPRAIPLGATKGVLPDDSSDATNTPAPATPTSKSFSPQHGSTYDPHADETPEHHAAHAFGEYYAAGKVYAHDNDNNMPHHNPPHHIAREARDDEPEWKSYWSAFHAATALHKASVTSHLPTYTGYPMFGGKGPKPTGGPHGYPGENFEHHAWRRNADQDDEGFHPWAGWCNDADVECDATITNAALTKRFADAVANADAAPRNWRNMLVNGHFPMCGMPGMVCKRGLDTAAINAQAAAGEDVCSFYGVECSDEVAASLSALSKRNAEAEAEPAKKGQYQPLWHGYLPFCGTHGIRCRRGITDEILAARMVGGPTSGGKNGEGWTQGTYPIPHHKMGGEKDGKGGWWSGFWPSGRG